MEIWNFRLWCLVSLYFITNLLYYGTYLFIVAIEKLEKDVKYISS